MSAAPVAVNVSPLIRFGRYSLLFAGIAYGAMHRSRLEKKETKRREREEQLRIENAPKVAAEKKRIQEEEFAYLERTGIKFN